MTQHCRYCGGGAVDIYFHEENCVMRPTADKPKGVCLQRPCEWPRCSCRVDIVYTLDYVHMRRGR